MFERIKNMFFKKMPVNSKNPSILIVDDSEIDRKVVESVLSKRGFNTMIAVNGEEGLAIARSRKPDLIVLDCEMPIMNGPDMCKHLKEDEQIKRIPVLFLTSVDTPKNIVDCFQLDAENFLAKPVNPKVLTSQIDLILKDFLRK